MDVRHFTMCHVLNTVNHVRDSRTDVGNRKQMPCPRNQNCWALTSRSKKEPLYSGALTQSEVIPGPLVVFLETHSRDWQAIKGPKKTGIEHNLPLPLLLSFLNLGDCHPPVSFLPAGHISPPGAYEKTAKLLGQCQDKMRVSAKLNTAGKLENENWKTNKDLVKNI